MHPCKISDFEDFLFNILGRIVSYAQISEKSVQVLDIV
jgi:hypothetical protein